MVCPIGIEPTTFSFGGGTATVSLSTEINSGISRNDPKNYPEALADLVEKIRLITSHCIVACAAYAPQPAKEVDDDVII
jgi:hypothetical protein